MTKPSEGRQNTRPPGSSLLTAFKADKYLDFHHQTSDFSTMVTKGLKRGKMQRSEFYFLNAGQPRHAERLQMAVLGELPRRAERPKTVRRLEVNAGQL